MPNTISLRQTNFTPISPTLSEYRPLQRDYNIMANSMARMETRKKETYEKRAGIHSVFGKLSAEMHDDEATKEWLAAYEDRINKDIDEQIEAGDYGNAISVIANLGGQLAKDPSVIGRIKNNAAYNKQMELLQNRVTAGKVNQATADYYKATHQYKDEEITDKNGRVIGIKMYDPKDIPVDDIDLDQEAFATFKLISPDKGSGEYAYSSSAGGVSDKGLHQGVANANTMYVSKRAGGSSYEKVTAKQILEALDNRMQTNQSLRDAMIQQYNVAKWQYKNKVEELKQLTPGSEEYNDLKQQLEQQGRLFVQNNGFVDYKTYYARLVTDNLTAKNLAYDWRTSSTQIGYGANIVNPESGSGRGKSRSGGQGYEEPLDFLDTKVKAHGPNVIIGVDSSIGDQNGDDINTLFNQSEYESNNKSNSN